MEEGECLAPGTISLVDKLCYTVCQACSEPFWPQFILPFPGWPERLSQFLKNTQLVNGRRGGCDPERRLGRISHI